MTTTNAVPARLYELGGVPIDRLARRQMLPGTNWEPRLKNGGEPVFDTPPPFASITVRPGETPTQDLAGRRAGMLTVVGYFGRGPGGKQKWVCRCVCARYVIRIAATLKRGTDGSDKCRVCRHLDYLKHQSLSRAVGFECADVIQRVGRVQACTTTQGDSHA